MNKWLLRVLLLAELFILSETHDLFACGFGSSGQLGNGSFISSNVPVYIDIIAPVKIAAGKVHTLVLDESGKVFTFGSNYDLTLGYEGDNQALPKMVNFSFKVVDVFAGQFTSFVLSEDGAMYGFGNNYFGQLGIGNFSDNEYPTLIDFGANVSVVKVVSGGSYTLVLDDNGTLYGFGVEEMIYLDSESPVVLDYDVIDIASGYDFYIAVKIDGSVVGRGRNTGGELGQGNFDNCDDLCDIPFDVAIVAVDAGDESALFLDETGVLYTTGNIDGYMGQGENQGNPDPTPQFFDENIVSMNMGSYHGVMIKDSGLVILFGDVQYTCFEGLEIDEPMEYGDFVPYIFSDFEGGRVVLFEAGGFSTYFYYDSETPSTTNYATTTIPSSSTSSESSIFTPTTTKYVSTIPDNTSTESTSTSTISTDISTGIEIENIEQNYQGEINESNKHLSFQEGVYNNITIISLEESTVDIKESEISIININTYRTNVNMENSDISVDNDAVFHKSSILLSDSSIVIDGDMTISETEIHLDVGSTLLVGGCLVVDGQTNFSIDANRGSGNIIEYDCIDGDESNLKVKVHNLDSNCESEVDISDTSLSTVFLCDATKGNWWVYVVFGGVSVVVVALMVYAAISYRNRVRTSIKIINTRQQFAEEKKIVTENLKNLKAEIAITKQQVSDLENLVNENELTSLSLS
eukprot:TRINITY_DN9667_c0_g1_i1.p1 TRINITY_DN9667_c0_g1~~TRINITY_DN9667_c0_g1_i1.p1  ORF type:complete len:691 (+),score=166.74 TRINITY_DN9667_c0_g1_i1:33-2105(+)